MNTGQMMITIGAMMLLSFLILRVNSTQVVSQGTIVDSKLGIVALTVANTYVDFAKRQVFDFAVIDSTLSSVDLADLKSPGNLGPEGGEVYPFFDDLDDFNLWDPALGRNIVITDTTTLASSTNAGLFTPFFVTSKVYYVSESNLDLKVNTRTWYKRLDVFVWTVGNSDTIKYSSISTMW
jgi:hypothetical protein